MRGTRCTTRGKAACPGGSWWPYCSQSSESCRVRVSGASTASARRQVCSRCGAGMGYTHTYRKVSLRCQAYSTTRGKPACPCSPSVRRPLQASVSAYLATAACPKHHDNTQHPLRASSWTESQCQALACHRRAAKNVRALGAQAYTRGKYTGVRRPGVQHGTSQRVPEFLMALLQPPNFSCNRHLSPPQLRRHRQFTSLAIHTTCRHRCYG